MKLQITPNEALHPSTYIALAGPKDNIVPGGWNIGSVGYVNTPNEQAKQQHSHSDRDSANTGVIFAHV